MSVSTSPESGFADPVEPRPTGTAIPDWAFQAGPRLDQELDTFAEAVSRFRSGVLTEAQFRVIRVPAGVYEQRESGTYMLRVRFPAGGVLPGQLRRLGEVSARFGNALLHVTTRQEFQVHRVAVEAIVPALRSLAEVGLSSKGGGGNTVRNITACADSGVCPEQVFDVTPYAVAVTERLLADPSALQLPRKYKISFAACGRDCGGATVQDLGFVAREREGLPGFAVYVGGGMGGKSRLASKLHEFIPAEDAYVVAEAVKRVFDQHGDRRNKHLARLRFLIERVGLGQFQDWYETELAALRASQPEPLKTRPVLPRPAPVAEPVTKPETGAVVLERWIKQNVSSQRQPGFHRVSIPLPLGDLPAAKAAALADLVGAHGDRVLWATQAQNVGLRWVTTDELPAVHAKLAALGLAEPEPPVLRNLVACAGASTCRLGICLSRGLARAVRDELAGNAIPLDRWGDLSIHISGCPNSCGRHPVGNIGLSGAARRIGDQLVPYYAVQVGGRLGEGRSRFGTHVGAVPARWVPMFVRGLLEAWQRSPDAGDFHAFLEHGGQDLARALADRHPATKDLAGQPDLVRDWDANSAFSLTGRGQGECSASAFDLIEVDLVNAREAQEAGHYYAATLAAARALLVTRRVEARSDADALALFQEHFIASGLVDGALAGVVQAGVRAATTTQPAASFTGAPGDVAALVAAVRLLHENLDASLQFRP